MFKGKWVSARTRSYVNGGQYWAVVFVIEQRLGKFPIEVLSGRSGVEFDRLYMLSFWDNVKLGWYLHGVDGHPVFGIGRSGL